MVASTSAFISTTRLPCWNASRMTLRAELDRAGDVDDHVDLRRAADGERVLGDDRLAPPDRLVERGLGAGGDDVVAPA